MTYSKTALHILGHVQLCGVLHVTWQTRDGADGQYMISILYRDFLILATTGRGDQTYNIQACIGLGDLRVEEADNGRGRRLFDFSQTLKARSYNIIWFL